MYKQLSRLWDHQHWSIALVDAPVHRFLEPDFVPELEWLPDPAFSADPFLVEHNGKQAILYEEFDYVSHRGRISAIELNEEGFGKIHRDVMADAFHFSYPSVLHWKGKLFCIPEHSNSGKLQAYRCDEFPNRWTAVDVLLPGVPVVDPTLIEHDGRWWMFCTRLDKRPNERLYLYWSDSPFGPWTEHAMNPVKIDAASARPAGPLFEHEGKLYRPAQDCSQRYGGALVIHEIEELSLNRFSERIARRLEPFAASQFPLGIHHLCGLGNRTVLDGLRGTYSWRETCFVLKDWGRKVLKKVGRGG